MPSQRSIREMGSVLRERASDCARDLFSSVEVGPLLGRGTRGLLELYTHTHMHMCIYLCVSMSVYVNVRICAHIYISVTLV